MNQTLLCENEAGRPSLSLRGTSNGKLETTLCETSIASSGGLFVKTTIFCKLVPCGDVSQLEPKSLSGMPSRYIRLECIKNRSPDQDEDWLINEIRSLLLRVLLVDGGPYSLFLVHMAFLKLHKSALCFFSHASASANL